MEMTDRCGSVRALLNEPLPRYAVVALDARGSRVCINRILLPAFNPATGLHDRVQATDRAGDRKDESVFEYSKKNWPLVDRGVQPKDGSFTICGMLHERQFSRLQANIIPFNG
jgi:hypothetical protein